MTMSGKQKYFPNNWRDIRDAPDEWFEPCEFVELMEKAWSIRPGHAVVIRAKNLKTGKIKEYAYKQEKSASDRIHSLMDTHEMTIVTDEIIGTINYDTDKD